MNKNFKCPLCGEMQPMSKKLHGFWSCPNCRHTVIPTSEIRQAGKMPQSYLNAIYGIRKKYRKEQFLKSKVNDKKFLKVA